MERYIYILVRVKRMYVYATALEAAAPTVFTVWLRTWQKIVKTGKPAVLNSDGFKQH
jgi:hypothetical protein